MLRRFLIATIIGMLTFAAIYFALPLALSRADIVAGLAAAVLELSNRFFDPMPRILVDYVALMNLPVVALTSALLAMLAALLLMTACGLAARTIRLIAVLFRREPKEEAPRDLSSIDIDARYLRDGAGKEVLGRGMDRIERD